MDKVQTRSNTPVSEFLSRFRFGHPAASKPVLEGKIVSQLDETDRQDRLFTKLHPSSSSQRSDSCRQDRGLTDFDLPSRELSSLNQQDDPTENFHALPPCSPSLNRDFSKEATKILTAGSIEQEDLQEEGCSDQRSLLRLAGIRKAEKGDELLSCQKRTRIGDENRKYPDERPSESPEKVAAEVITYKRRIRIGGQKRKNLDDTGLESLDSVGDGEAYKTGAYDQSSYNSAKMFGICTGEGDGFRRAEALSTLKTFKRVTGSQKTPPSKRIVGQYFLDLGQSDFSHSTCPTCKLFYARGHENDEKVHKTFHRNFTQGIVFKGWQSERIVSRLDDKGNRVIVVLAEDTHHQTKVREVIDVMELELGLTPGWLLQRSCKVYLFISSSKKIVGCLMAEPIKSAFRVVPAQRVGPGKYGEPTPCDVEETKPSFVKTEPPDSAPDEHCSQLDRNVSKPHGIDKSEDCSIDGERHLPKSSPTAWQPEDEFSSGSLTSISVTAASGNAPACVPKVKEVLPLTVKREPVSVRERRKTQRITDFFTLKTRQLGSQGGGKPEWEDIDSKPDVKGHCLKAEADEESKQNDVVGGQDKQPNFRQPENEEKVLRSHVSEAAEDEGKLSASVTRKIGVQDEDSREGRKNRNNVMVFGNIKFSRETLPRKRPSKERTQDLGSAILCTKTPVPAVCGVRVIWVSHSERRKGVATHLLDAMRKTFCLGVVLEPSQFAFSQPTPEGRRFAAQYCRTDEFLVYTTS